MQLNKLYKNKLKYTVENKGDSKALAVVFTTSDGSLSTKDRWGILNSKGRFSDLVAASFNGSAGEVSFFAEKRLILVGLGTKEAAKEGGLKKSAEVFRKLARHAAKLKYSRLDLHLASDPTGLQKHLGADWYRFIPMAFEYSLCKLNLLATSNNRKSDSKEKSVSLQKVVLIEPKDEKAARRGLREGQAEAISVNRARQIASMPGNHFTPSDFEKAARRVASEHKLQIQVMGESELKKNGMGGILAVSRGSAEPARLISLQYKGSTAKNAKTLCIVGKGLTFDTGGISLKPPAEMHEMKYDMCGGAAALYAIEAIARLKLKLNVVSLIASAENMPGSKATKPGDVYTSYKGLTVEVQNTDAEGRLVLADALTYSKKYKPDYLVDLATLTGAILISLGDSAAGLFANDEGFASILKKASQSSLDPVWQMPMWDDYAEGLKSDIADVRNIGGRLGGSISAGKFLEKFIPPRTAWAHLDIAGTAWLKSDRGMLGGPGATGMGVRLLVDAARIISGQRK